MQTAKRIINFQFGEMGKNDKGIVPILDHNFVLALFTQNNN